MSLAHLIEEVGELRYVYPWGKAREGSGELARIEFIEGVELLRDGEWVECTTLQHTDSMGCEHLYYMAKDTGELLAAELIDGRWLDVELGMARAKLAEIQASFA